MEEVVLWLKELLFPSVADVEVLSVDVSIAIDRVDTRCTADGAVCPGCGVWSSRVHGTRLLNGLRRAGGGMRGETRAAAGRPRYWQP